MSFELWARRFLDQPWRPTLAPASNGESLVVGPAVLAEAGQA
jgi:hypothetical protein